MKKSSVILSFILLLLFSAAAVIPFFVKEEAEAESTYGGILRLWNIDSFEGGKGSRTQFLKTAAALYEKKHKGVYISVSSATLSGYSYALTNGGAPDMVSFGIGTDFSYYAKELKSGGFVGGKIGDVSYAYPWCRGGYAVYSLADDFSDISPENTIISSGGSNFPLIAAVMYGLNGGYKCEESLSAYTDFLSGKYKYLFGTQRDYSRFLSRGKAVYASAVDGYNDLYQYIAILNGGEAAYNACLSFIEFLLSDEIQERLSSVAMISDVCKVYSPSDGVLYEMQSLNYSYTLGAFTGAEALNEIKTLSERAIALGETKNLKNYLKTVA